MDSFPDDCNYLPSYLEGLNKCDYAWMAVLAYESSSQGRIEKQEFFIILDNFRKAFERRSVVTYRYDGMDEVVGVDLIRLYNMSLLVHKAYKIIVTTEDWELESDFEDAETTAELEGVAFKCVWVCCGGRRIEIGFTRTVVFLIYIEGWRKGASSRGAVVCLPWMRILCASGRMLFSLTGSIRLPMGIGVSMLRRGGSLMVTTRVEGQRKDTKKGGEIHIKELEIVGIILKKKFEWKMSWFLCHNFWTFHF